MRRIHKPETIYPPYKNDIGGVYAGRQTNNNNIGRRVGRSIAYDDGVILPERIEDLSPQPSPTGSIQAQESYEILATGEQRRVTITSNSMTVDTVRLPRRYSEKVSRHRRNNQNDNQDIDVETNQQHTLAPTRRRTGVTNNRNNQTEDIRDFDDSEEDDAKTPSWTNRYIRNQNRNMNTLTNLLNDRLSGNDDNDESNRQTTRKREFDKYIEKLRIEHDLRTRFSTRLGKGRMTDVEAQVVQIEWYEEVERFAEKSGLRQIDQSLLVKLVAENSLCNDVLRMYRDTVRED